MNFDYDDEISDDELAEFLKRKPTLNKVEKKKIENKLIDVSKDKNIKQSITKTYNDTSLGFSTNITLENI